MRISALIPTYNRREHTLRAVASVLAQTTPVDEIIVVDDGSTDGTAETVCSHYGSRVRLIRQENAGVSSARNRGIQVARGEWLAFLDSDDQWLPEKLTRQFTAIATIGESEVGACFTDCVFEGNAAMRQSAFQKAGLRSRSSFEVLDDPASYVLSTRPVIFVQSLVVRRAVVEELGGFDEAMVVSEDTDLLFRLALKTRMCFVAEPLVRIDRTPTRLPGLCELYSSRDDRVFDSSAWLYRKLLAMPEVMGTTYEAPLREKLRSVRYNSLEAKIHQLRLRSALRELGRLKDLGEGYAAVAVRLMARKLEKLRRSADPQYS